VIHEAWRLIASHLACFGMGVLVGMAWAVWWPERSEDKNG